MTQTFDIIDQYVILCRGTLPEMARAISDGQPVETHATIDGMQVGLAVGWTSDQDPAVIEIEPEGLAWSDREQVQIRSTLWVSWGDTDEGFKPLRDEARRLFNTIQDAVKANPKLGLSNVLTSYIRFTDLDQVQTKDGPSVAMRFNLHVDCFSRLYVYQYVR